MLTSISCRPPLVTDDLGAALLKGWEIQECRGLRRYFATGGVSAILAL